MCIRDRIQPGDVTITYADITKSKKLLGYSPETSIEQGIRNFVEWYKRTNHSETAVCKNSGF